MPDTDAIESEIRSAIEAAADEAALEAVRVSALGKKGSISELLKTLGSMSPEERQEAGPRFNGLKDRINEALADRREALKSEALARRLVNESTDVTLPVRASPLEEGRIHPVSQV